MSRIGLVLDKYSRLDAVAIDGVIGARRGSEDDDGNVTWFCNPKLITAVETAEIVSAPEITGIVIDDITRVTVTLPGVDGPATLELIRYSRRRKAT